MGGALDLALGPKKPTPTRPGGSSKIVPAYTLPVTAYGVVDLGIAKLAVFAYENGQLTLTELMPGATLAEVRAKTSVPFAERLRGSVFS